MFDTCVNNKSKSSFTMSTCVCLLSHYKKVSLVTIYYLAKYQNRYKLQGPTQRFNNLATHFTILRLDIKERQHKSFLVYTLNFRSKKEAMIRKSKSNKTLYPNTDFISIFDSQKPNFLLWKWIHFELWLSRVVVSCLFYAKCRRLLRVLCTCNSTIQASLEGFCSICKLLCSFNAQINHHH